MDGGRPLRFTDVTAEAGLTHTQGPYRSPPDCLLGVFSTPGNHCQPEEFAGGAAAGDYDGDGRVDLFFTRIDAPDLLFHNEGDGTFRDVSASAGFTQSLTTNGAAWGDIDADGDLDLYVTTIADTRFYLYVNDGSGHFSEEALLRGAAVEAAHPSLGFSVSFGDYDRDGFLDLHVCEMIARGASNIETRTRLLRNRGAAAPGYFEDVTDAAGLGTDPIQFAFTSTFADLDADGWPDLAVAADFGHSRLFWNRGDGTFEDGTVAAGVGTDENAMGSALGDYDGDGRLDWFVTAIFDPSTTCLLSGCGWGDSGNRLFHNEGARRFADHTDRAAVREGGWGWGAAFFDYDHDGHLDLAMTNGFRSPQTDLEDRYHADPMRLWQGGGLPMIEVAAYVGLDDTGQGRALIPLDYDGDGDLDLLITHNAAGPVLYRNEIGQDAPWLRVRVVTAAGSPALGTVVEVEPTIGDPVQVRYLGVEYGYLGNAEPIAHFGLGVLAGNVARVTVRPPRGAEQTLTDVVPRQTLEVRVP